MKKNLTKLIVTIFSIFVFLVFATLVSNIFSHNLDQLISDEEHTTPTKVKFISPQKVETKPKPIDKTIKNSLMASLAPDSMKSQDLGAGISFGGSGGLKAGGGGGFSTSVGSLVNAKSNVNKPPKLIFKSDLEYPHEARLKNITGYVNLKIYVNELGAVEKVEIESSEPKGIFDLSAIKSIKNWKFEPAVIKGTISGVWTTQKIRFSLN